MVERSGPWLIRSSKRMSGKTTTSLTPDSNGGLVDWQAAYLFVNFGSQQKIVSFLSGTKHKVALRNIGGIIENVDGFHGYWFRGKPLFKWQGNRSTLNRQGNRFNPNGYGMRH